MRIFGGDDGSRTLNEIWALNLTLGSENWERLNPSGTPPIARFDQYAIYHPARNSLIIFGGEAGNYQWQNDAWELKLDSMVWREISVPSRPAPRVGGGELFDAANNRMILFGGSAWSTWYNEVWALDLTPGNENWTQLYPYSTTLMSLIYLLSTGHNSSLRVKYQMPAVIPQWFMISSTITSSSLVRYVRCRLLWGNLLPPC